MADQYYYVDGYIAEDYFGYVAEAEAALSGAFSPTFTVEVADDTGYYIPDYIAEGYYALPIQEGEAALSAAATLSSTGDRIRFADSDLSVAATLSADVSRTRSSAVNVSVSATQSAAVSRSRDSSAQLDSAATIIASPVIGQQGEATLTTSVTLSATAVKTVDAQTSFDTAFSASMTVNVQRVGDSLMETTASLSALANVTASADITLETLINYSLQGDRIRYGAATPSVAATLGLDIGVIKQANSTLSTNSTLQASAITVEGTGVTLSSAFSLTAQALDIGNQKFFGAYVPDLSASTSVAYPNRSQIVTDAEQNVYAIGIDDSVASLPRVQIVKFDGTGNEVWQKSYTAAGNTTKRLGKATSDATGMYIPYAYWNGTNMTSLLHKIDFEGNIEWAKQYYVAVDLTHLTVSGDYLYASGVRGGGDLLLSKLDLTDGTVDWTRYWNPSSQYVSDPHSFVIGNYIYTLSKGSTTLTSDSDDLMLQKTSLSGAIQSFDYITSLYGANNIEPNAYGVDNSGNIYIAGRYNSSGDRIDDLFLLKMDTSYSIDYVKTYEINTFEQDETVYDLLVDGDSFFVTTSDDKIYSFDTSDGSINWIRNNDFVMQNLSISGDWLQGIDHTVLYEYEPTNFRYISEGLRVVQFPKDGAGIPISYPVDVEIEQDQTFDYSAASNPSAGSTLSLTSGSLTTPSASTFAPQNLTNLTVVDTTLTVNELFTIVFAGPSSLSAAFTQANTTVDRIRDYSSSISGAFIQNSAINVIRSAESTVEAAATLGSSPVKTTDTGANIAVAATLSAEGDRVRFAEGSISANTTLETELNIIRGVPAAIDASATLDATGLRIQPGTVDMEAIATTLTVAAKTGNFLIAMDTKFTQSATVQIVAGAVADLDVVAAQSAQAQVITDSAATLDIAATQTSSGDRIRFGSSTIEAAATLDSTAVKTTDVDTAMSAAATMTVAAERFRDTSVDLNTTATATATALKVIAFDIDPIEVQTTAFASAFAVFRFSGEFEAIASSLTAGRVIHIDPYRQLIVPQETKTIRVKQETRVLVVD